MKQVLLALVLLCAIAATCRASDGNTVTAGTTQDITAFSVCKRVTNNTAYSLYVPTTSADEWSSFYSHPTASVGIANCPTSCAGKSVGGYCWYVGVANQSCDTTCASHGGTTDGTINYTGSGGTLANCQAVSQALGLVSTQYIDNPTASIGGIGCYYLFMNRPPPGPVQIRMTGRATGAATNQSATNVPSRICSCVQ